jgi:hypothetical protein
MELCSDQKFTCKYIKISNWSYAQVNFPASFCQPGGSLYRSTVWLDGARPPPKVCFWTLKIIHLEHHPKKKKNRQCNCQHEWVSHFFIYKKVSFMNSLQWKNTKNAFLPIQFDLGRYSQHCIKTSYDCYLSKGALSHWRP